MAIISNNKVDINFLLRKLTKCRLLCLFYSKKFRIDVNRKHEKIINGYLYYY